MSWYIKALRNFASKTYYLNWKLDSNDAVSWLLKQGVKLYSKEMKLIRILDGREFELEYTIFSEEEYLIDGVEIEMPEGMPEKTWTKYLASYAEEVLMEALNESPVERTPVAPQSSPAKDPRELFLDDMMGDLSEEWRI